MNPTLAADIQRAADVVESRALLLGDNAPQGRIYHALAARLRAAVLPATEGVEAVAEMKLYSACGNDGPLLCAEFTNDARLRLKSGDKLYTAPPAADARDAGLTLVCVDCRREVALPYTDATKSRVSLVPLNGWEGPPLRCPRCRAMSAASQDREKA